MSPNDLVNLTYVSTGHEITRREVIVHREKLARRDATVAASKHNNQSQAGKVAAVQQNLALAPPLPILNIGTNYILGQVGANATINGNRSLGIPPDNVHQGKAHPHRARRTELTPLSKRVVEGPIQCGAGNPCADGSCCNSVSCVLPLLFMFANSQNAGWEMWFQAVPLQSTIPSHVSVELRRHGHVWS